ncbi:hypothetical protein JDM601_4076 [Mycolicibacter sinensis]|uniref:Uncharacterized protein n=1 Tax=Mycolicibacter sinensis (strain JDM601) TaxID=875328 RepID=F5YTP5_MYCSD|nr:hypothetical protein JDM601_4076 [Mycolicibacter sinensis]
MTGLTSLAQAETDFVVGVTVRRLLAPASGLLRSTLGPASAG